MKLHLSHSEGRNNVTGYGPGYVLVNGIRYEQSLVLLPDSIIEHWGCAAGEPPAEEALRFLSTLGMEVVLIGTGEKPQFPIVRNLRALVEAGVGYEIMGTSAACRTFNILVAEDRKVAAALQL